MTNSINEILDNKINDINESGLYKHERIIESSQSANIRVNGLKVINFCSNNYLGLANHPEIIKSAKEGLEKWGFGLSWATVSQFYLQQTILLHAQKNWPRLMLSHQSL